MKHQKLLIVFICIFLNSCGGQVVNKKRDQISAPFNGKTFENLEPFPDKSLLDVLKWRFNAIFNVEPWPKEVEQIIYQPEFQRSENLKIIVVNHSTVLIQINNKNILTDPHFSERASPLSFLGPKRVRPPAITFENLPPIDYVVISHDHYDHLDLPSLKRINEKHSAKFFVGLGNAELLKSEGITNVTEMDWWEKIELESLKLNFVPVQHWSARGVFDRKKTLWGGFVIEGNQKIFFAGDTGYGKVFKMIHERYGDIDLSIIPIGAYEPRYFMKYAHVNPMESVKIFSDIKSKKAIGIHFKTFADLTDEWIDHPERDLKKALKENQIEESRFIVPEFGQTYHF